jgi:hypothetical protein
VAALCGESLELPFDAPVSSATTDVPATSAKPAVALAAKRKRRSRSKPVVADAVLADAI